MTSFIFAITLTILFISPTKLLPTVNANNIRDDKGNQIINGANYYIKSNMAGPNDGSINRAYNASSAQPCPAFATQGHGTYTPVNIYSYPSSEYIPLGANVTIIFLGNASPCNGDVMTWSAMASDLIVNVLHVVAGGFPRGSFEVVDSGINQKNVYKFKYCTDGLGCLDVGWLANSGDPYLAMTTDPTMMLTPFYFVFVKAY